METSVNNKCKAFTSLEQSKKLAEILPLESADMIWVLANPDLPMIRAIAYEDSEKSKYYEILPAWSLAALLDILKDKITFGGASDKDWFVAYTVKTPRELLTIYESNLVDACVAMIEKLHELNLL